MATLGQQTIGSIVKLNVNGVATNFIVVHQGLPGTMYDSSCNGTWLLMESIYKSSAYGTNNYASSDPADYLNSDFINLFDSGIKKYIKQVKIPFVDGGGADGSLATGTNGLSTKMFLLSYHEVYSQTTSYAPEDGDILAYFKGASNGKRVAKYNNSAYSWGLRTPYARTARYAMWYVTNAGAIDYQATSLTVGIRPAFILLPEIEVGNDGTIIVESGAITGKVIINGVQRELTGKGYININGVLRDLSDSQVNVGGTLRATKG